MSSTEHTTAVNVHRDDVGSRMGMWLFLFTELILFGGMFLLYSVYRFQYPDAFHLAAKELNTIMGAFNTAVLLTSSMTMALSIVAIQRDQKILSMLLQMITIFLALFFLVNKYFEWTAKFHHGIYPGSEELLSKSSGEILFFGLYYVMTGLHGVHVIVGILSLKVVLHSFLDADFHRHGPQGVKAGPGIKSGWIRGKKESP